MRLLVLCFSISLLWLYAEPSARAFDLGSERVRVNGFGTFGMTSAGTKLHGFHKELNQSGQFGGLSASSGSNLGMQLDVDILSNLSATVQAVVEERARYDFNNMVDWAFLRYQVNPNMVARAGRMGTDIFMLSEYRNVGFAYLWAHPVTEFYAPVLFSHFNGADLKYSYPIKAGHLDFKVFGGQTHADAQTGRSDLHMTMRPFFGANVMFESEHWKARLTFSRAKLSSVRGPTDQLAGLFNQVPAAVWPQLATLPDKLNGEGRWVIYQSAGLAYDNNKWLVQSEIAMVSSEWSGANLLNGYFSVGRRFGSVTLYSVAASARSRDKLTKVNAPLVSLPGLDQLQIGAQNAFRSARINQSTVSLGMRWDFRPKMALKAQWDHTWVDRNGGGLLVLKEPLEKDITLNIFSVNLNFIF
ncbi:MAG: hypothetical protein OEX82_09150 [Nitrosomonas sp.]|nr:hypothetical protein [Nitrosomonas sp.]